MKDLKKRKKIFIIIMVSMIILFSIAYFSKENSNTQMIVALFGALHLPFLWFLFDDEEEIKKDNVPFRDTGDCYICEYFKNDTIVMKEVGKIHYGKLKDFISYSGGAVAYAEESTYEIYGKKQEYICEKCYAKSNQKDIIIALSSVVLLAVVIYLSVIYVSPNAPIFFLVCFVLILSSNSGPFFDNKRDCMLRDKFREETGYVVWTPEQFSKLSKKD